MYFSKYIGRYHLYACQEGFEFIWRLPVNVR
jgi:hypothetical protein